MQQLPASQIAKATQRCGLIPAVGLLASLASASIHASPQTAFDRSVERVEAGLARLVGCRWSITGRVALCPMPETGGVLTLTQTPAGDVLETVEINVLVATYPQRNLVREWRSRDQAIDVVQYILPNWLSAREWLSRALHAARHAHVRHTIKVGTVTVLVQWLQPADLDDTFATLVVTRKDFS
jgi:hypothetical protein